MNRLDHDFYSALNQKISVDPSPSFDRRFWARFESEFPTPKFQGWLSWKVLVPALSLGVVALAYFGFREAPQEKQLASAMIEHLPMLAELDLYETLDDVEMPDEDWEILLGVEAAHASTT